MVKEKNVSGVVEVAESELPPDLEQSTSPKQNDSTQSGIDPKLSIDESVVPKPIANDTSVIDYNARQNAIDSDKDYRKITGKIIGITYKELGDHTKAKNPLRTSLSNFIIILLAIQFIALIAILFLNRVWNLQISDFVINVYIVSVFVETLAGLTIMIRFAFDSKQEVELIKILNAIIINFKKYDEK